MRFSNDFFDFGFNLNHLSVILSGQDTRFFPERLTGAVGKGFLMVKAVANLLKSLYDFNNLPINIFCWSRQISCYFSSDRMHSRSNQ